MNNTSILYQKIVIMSNFSVKNGRKDHQFKRTKEKGGEEDDPIQQRRQGYTNRIEEEHFRLLQLILQRGLLLYLRKQGRGG